MKIVCAPDSFKESMTAAQAAQAMADGIADVLPQAQTVQLPLADGGEGTARALADCLGGRMVPVRCHDALGRERTADIAHLADQRLAIVESAGACGLEHLSRQERDPMVTSTFGVGELLLAALDLGVDTIVLGLGGSATNDAGSGMLSALGVRFLDDQQRCLPLGGGGLSRVHSVDLSGLDPRLATVQVRAACDVTNPLTGPQGASAVFGPQKGAKPEQVEELDRALASWGRVVARALGREVATLPGAGAAGGLGAAVLCLPLGTLEAGADLVMDAAGLDQALEGADLLLTGEGSFDSQSADGKVPFRAAQRASRHGVASIILAGRVDLGEDGRAPDPLAAAVPIIQDVSSLDEALAHGERNLRRATANLVRLLAVGQTLPPINRKGMHHW